LLLLLLLLPAVDVAAVSCSVSLERAEGIMLLVADNVVDKEVEEEEVVLLLLLLLLVLGIVLELEFE